MSKTPSKTKQKLTKKSAPRAKPKVIKTIQSWFEKDENGKVNKVAITVFCFLAVYPIIAFEGIKTGLFAKYDVSTDVGLMKVVKGLGTPFGDIMAMNDQQNFGLTTRSFDPTALVLFSFAWLCCFAISYIMADRYRRRSYRKDGDMAWQNIKKFNQDFAEPKGADEPCEPEENSGKTGNMILSEHVRYSLEPKGTNTYSCALIVGATGSGKSFTYVKPNILQMNSNYVVTDPKGELAASCGKALMNHGYDVKIFNVSEAQYGCRYNPFHYLYCPQDVVTLVDTFIKNTDDPDAGGGDDQFFSLAVQNFFTMIFYYIYTCCPPEKQTFKTVYEMYLEADEPETRPGQKAEATEFDKKFLRLLDPKDPAFDPTNPALPCYQTFKKGTAKTKQSILISAGVRLGFMSTPEIANMLSGDDLHLETMADRKSALFAIIPAEKKDFNFLAAMMFTQLFNVLYRYGNVVNEKSWLLTKGDTVALRSKPFVAGTKTEQDEKEELIRRQEKYKKAVLEDDNERMEKDPEFKEAFLKPDENGFIPWPCCRLVYTDQNGVREVLEEFKSRRAAEIVLDAAINGKIHKGSKSLSCHVRFILDEFFNVGKLPNFDTMIATFRSLRISADIIVQSVAQLKEMYDDKQGKIMSNCSITILLGANDLDDCKLFSELIGQTTVQSESINIDRKGIVQGSNGGSLSDNAESLLRPENIRTMPKDECLIIVNTSNPIRDKKYIALKHPRWKETFDDHCEDQLDNELQIGRIFHIEQKKENLITVTIPQPDALTSGQNNTQAQVPTISGMAGGMIQRPQQRPPRPAREVVNGRFERVQPRAGAEGFLGAGEKARMNRPETLRRPATVEERIADVKEVANKDNEVAVKDLNNQDRALLIRGLKDGTCEVKREPEKPPKIVTKSEADMIDDMFG